MLFNQAAGIRFDAEKDAIIMTIKHNKRVNTPSKSTSSIVFSKDQQKTIKGISAILSSYCRSDLTSSAARRVKALLRSQKTPAPLRIKKLRGRKARLAASNSTTDADDMIVSNTN